ncbi:hypothetical protein Lfu02_02440 [Longispora fulva]|uniref:Uncharacterized protein (DUF58 family) n=1 Tax=Longispora fulva TaxID=619741 RepID=A0A8J7GMV0_9ACTN|nr:DUF58 domain-containing protein [Longispora fulva]MBG6135884.1 uncharacterized protein (DUF58 family) [Longispora fulva]GIG55872.1 hypothetical protein Lfu02_02440 [Longispora fulva]
MRLTGRGLAVLGGAVVCYALGEWAGYPLLRAVAGVAAGALTAAALAALVRPRVEVRRTVHPDRVERGRPALASLVVRNVGGRGLAGFTAGDRIGDHVHQVRVRSLAAGAETAYHYELPTGVRGRLVVGPLALYRSDRLDLLRRELPAGGTSEVWVYPRLHAARPAGTGSARHHHDGPMAESPSHGSEDLRAVREYVPGDEVRHLHWKATARTGRLMVREYADPAQLRLTVLLDTRSAALSPELFEEAVEVAASLLYASTLAGQHCALLTPDARDMSTGSDARALLDELCLVTQCAEATIIPGTAGRPGGAVTVVTGADTELGPVRRWRPDTVVRLGAERTPGAICARDAADAITQWNALGAR